MVVFTLGVLGVLVAVAVIGGVLAGMGAPGGTPVIAALFLLTELGPASIAGTASAIFVAASVTATVLYARSGDIDVAVLLPLIPTTIVGTQFGVYLNQYVPRAGFGQLIAVLLLVIGPYLMYREYYDIPAKYTLDVQTWRGRGALAVLGGFVGIIGGLTGIGGLTITVPVLLLLSVPALTAISTGIAQSVFATSATTVGYLSAGVVDFKIAALIGIPFVISQVLGWQIAHRIETDRLVIVLGALFVLLGVYLLL